MRKSTVICVIISLLLVSMPFYSLAAESEKEIAFYSLEKVAQRDKSQRLLGGGLLVGLGGLFFLAEDDDNNNNTEVVWDSSVMGGLFAGMGAITLLVKTPAEREYRNVSQIEDAAKREEMAYQSLGYLADQAKRGRITSGISWGALSFLSLQSKSEVTTDSYNNYLALLYGGYSVYSFLVPSYAEKLYKQVKETKEKQYQVTIIPGFESMGVKVAFSF